MTVRPKPPLRPAVIVRNGSHLCAGCQKKGCDRKIGGGDDEHPYIGPPRPCDCCELDIVIAGDEFGI